MLRIQRIGRLGVALACAAAGVGMGSEANAGIPVIVLTTTTGAPGEATGRLGRVNAALQGNADMGPALAQALRERFGRRAPTANTLAEVTPRINAARAAYEHAAAASDNAAMNTALESLERIAGEFEAQPDVLAAFSDAREQLARTLLFIANTTIQSAPTRADDAIRRLAVADPQRVLSARAASSSVRQAFATRVQEIANAGLVVQSVTNGCEVFRDGRSVGNAPAQLSNLSPGSHHRINIRCGGRTSLVHPVTVASGVTSSITIDVQLDDALDVLDTPTLRYATLEAGHQRWVEDLARLGTALGATKILGLIPGEDRVIAVDVVSGSIIGATSVTDGAQIRRLALGPSSGSANTRVLPNPNNTNTANNNSGTTTQTNSGNSGEQGNPSNTVRPPNVGVVSNNQNNQRQREQYQEVVREVRGGVPAGAFVLGALAVGAFGAGVGLGIVSQGNYNRALQTGETITDSVRDRAGYADNAALFNYLAIGSHALGGALLVTGTLVGIFGRTTTTVTERVRLSAAPLREGAMITAGGSF